MAKLTKLQKKWVTSFEHTGVGSVSIHLLTILLKLKVLKNPTFVFCKNILVDQVRMWIRQEEARKERHADRQRTRAYDTRPPRSIKPTGTRS